MLTYQNENNICRISAILCWPHYVEMFVASATLAGSQVAISSILEVGRITVINLLLIRAFASHRLAKIITLICIILESQDTMIWCVWPYMELIQKESNKSVPLIVIGTGITQLSGVYVPYVLYIAPILCALLCKKIIILCAFLNLKVLKTKGT